MTIINFGNWKTKSNYERTRTEVTQFPRQRLSCGIVSRILVASSGFHLRPPQSICLPNKLNSAFPLLYGNSLYSQPVNNSHVAIWLWAKNPQKKFRIDNSRCGQSPFSASLKTVTCNLRLKWPKPKWPTVNSI